MRADRLLSILLLLQAHRRMTARTLAERLEVSERTIHRDMEALSGAGVPVVAERGAGGGWMLVEGYRTDLTGLNRAEVEALFFAKPSRLLADLQLDRASEGAVIKLLAALPAISRQSAEAVRARIHVDVSGWNRAEEAVPFLPALQEAVWRERRLRLAYGHEPGCAVERLVDPLGLVAKGSVWYFVAGVEGEVRSYRVSRVRGVEATGEPAVRPVDFDLAAFWEQSSSRFRESLPRYCATLRADAAILQRMRYALRFARMGEVGRPDGEGWVTVDMRFQFEEEACEFALSFGAQLEVVAPPSLREKVIAMAESVVKFYAGRMGHG